jgi:hypothetical protein
LTRPARRQPPAAVDERSSRLRLQKPYALAPINVDDVSIDNMPMSRRVGHAALVAALRSRLAARPSGEARSRCLCAVGGHRITVDAADVVGLLGGTPDLSILAAAVVARRETLTCWKEPLALRLCLPRCVSAAEARSAVRPSVLVRRGISVLGDPRYSIELLVFPRCLEVVPGLVEVEVAVPRLRPAVW